MWNPSRAFVLAVLAACSTTTAPAPGPDAPSTGDPGNNGSGSTSARAPKILSLHSNAAALTDKQSLVISAVVTDPDGIDDLIGGNLTTVDGASAYGAFSTDSSEGAYSISLSWSMIDATSAIATDPGQSASRTLRATFFDAEGNSSYQDVTVGLSCSDPTRGACDGTCMTFATDDHCGSCEHACPLPTGSRCQLQLPSGGHACVEGTDSNTRVACTTLCHAPYGVCSGGIAHYLGGEPDVNVGCNTVPPANADFFDLQCTCTDQ